MIPLSSATRVFVVTGATDMRKGFDGLYGIVANRLGMDPTSGHLFVFCNATRTRIKVLTWDGSGLWLCNKRHATQCPFWFFDKGSISLSPAFWCGA